MCITENQYLLSLCRFIERVGPGVSIDSAIFHAMEFPSPPKLFTLALWQVKPEQIQHLSLPAPSIPKGFPGLIELEHSKLNHIYPCLRIFMWVMDKFTLGGTVYAGKTSLMTYRLTIGTTMPLVSFGCLNPHFATKCTSVAVLVASVINSLSFTWLEATRLKFVIAGTRSKKGIQDTFTITTPSYPPLFTYFPKSILKDCLVSTDGYFRLASVHPLAAVDFDFHASLLPLFSLPGLVVQLEKGVAYTCDSSSIYAIFVDVGERYLLKPSAFISINAERVYEHNDVFPIPCDYNFVCLSEWGRISFDAGAIQPYTRDLRDRFPLQGSALELDNFRKRHNRTHRTIDGLFEHQDTWCSICDLEVCVCNIKCPRFRFVWY